MIKIEIKRMQIWTADLGLHPEKCIENGIRPVLIVSNNETNKNSPIVTVAPISSKINRLYLPGHVIIFNHEVFTNSKHKFKTGTVLLEQITTIDKKQLLSYFGRVKAIRKEKIINCRLGEFLAINKEQNPT